METAMSDERVVCLACGVINRVPAEKDARAAKCGSCGAELFAGHPPDVSAEMLERQITKGTLPVVVDVWAPWCGPCRYMGPEFEKASRTIEPRARFLKLNSDNEQDFSARTGIRGIPTMLLFKDGREADRVSGAMSAGQIDQWVKERISR
jgi:thioredoxin 2